ncbi:hypothetical protein Tco_1174231 [Tanacetum coccineum]
MISYEPEVKGTSSSSTQNIAFVSSNSTNNTNGAVNTTHGATTASTQATAVNLTSIDNLSDVVICAFFASQPNNIKCGFDRSKVKCYKTATKGDTCKGVAGLPRNQENRNSEAKASADKPKAVRKNNGAPIIEDWIFDSEEEDVPQAKIEKKTISLVLTKKEFVRTYRKNC